MPITRIISGGQTGSDRGGLDAAIYCDIPHGGWCPKGRKAEDGVIPVKYKLKEMGSIDYLKRTEANVVDSDATVVFTYGDATGGSLRTIQFATKHHRPCLHVDLDKDPRNQATQKIIDWFAGKLDTATPPSSCVLNVAGSRAKKAPGIEQAVMILLVDVISEVNGKLFYPLRDEG